MAAQLSGSAHASRPTEALVDLAALAGNLRAIRRMLDTESAAAGRTAPGIVAVVKANAYGHGAVETARALEAAGATMVAVADVPEGVTLREAGITVPILVFGALSVSNPEGVFTHDLTPTLSTPGAAAVLEREARARGVELGCHLKIDTGMHRLGFRDDHLQATLPEVLRSPHLRVDAVYTHFATADDPERDDFEHQRERFEIARERLAALGVLPRLAHAANSAALLRDARTWYDFVRPGLLLYGIVPPPLASTLDVRPVLSLRSRLVAVKGLRPGEHVGYGFRFTAERPCRIGVVPAGYADGLDWRLGNRGFALVGGRRVPIVGSVCMDMLMLDVTGLDVAPGDEAVFIGSQGSEHIDVREMAATIGSIPWELLCRLGSRIERIFRGQQ